MTEPTLNELLERAKTHFKARASRRPCTGCEAIATLRTRIKALEAGAARGYLA